MATSRRELADLIEQENIRSLDNYVDHGKSTLKYGGWGSLAGASYLVGRYTPAYAGFWNWLGNAYVSITENFGIVAQGAGYGMILGFAIYAINKLTKWFRRQRHRRRAPATA